MENPTEVQALELVPHAHANVPAETPAKKAPAMKTDPAKELRALKIENAKLKEDLHNVQVENATMADELAHTKKKAEWAKQYNRAALTNMSDQITVMQRTISILQAGGDQ